MFYNFRQNNSGGDFDYDEQRGISVNVIIEAESTDKANDAAEGIGIYFHGCDSGQDCSCCGDRWYRVSKGDGEMVPTVYGEEVSENQQHPPNQGENWFSKWMEEGKPEGFIHYLNGKVVGFHQVTSARTDLDGSYGYGVIFNRFHSSSFLVGENGWSEDGNSQAASKTKTKDSLGKWTKPDKATVHYYTGYGRAWFPSEKDAIEFLEKVEQYNQKIKDAISKVRVPKEHQKMWMEG
jgi:hypothetical protein